MKRKSPYQKRKEKRFRRALKDLHRSRNVLGGLNARLLDLDGLFRNELGALDESLDLFTAATCLEDAAGCVHSAILILENAREFRKHNPQGETR
jgi:hypothetical protein